MTDTPRTPDHRATATENQTETSGQAKPQDGQDGQDGVEPAAAERPREIGGRQGPEPTRYGDWEVGGLASDF
ncbi:hypothetical protein CCR80_10240 [Rhodothalassium salexigens]|uniref:DUF1674 domain-containing protein n=1 Tax=Rhodothalassium salexigens TaxID=1086 RepID=UPI0019135DC4|nr:succinate dehydrogenase assembly factor 4 [Rhodothalassium salexigens]MBK5921407.1 hypothetical protein [Rhodothalassium salexigens]